MSILIKGMEMPLRCINCPFSDDCGNYFVGVPGEWLDPEE